MAQKTVTDFEILAQIAEEGTEDGIAMFPDVLAGNKTSEGWEITIGTPDIAMRWHLNGTHYFILYAVNKADYKRIKSEMQKEL